VNSFWSVSAFWGIAALFVALALAFVLPPLLRRKAREAKAGRRSINIAVYRDQMKEMEADHRNGLLSDEQFAVAKVELEARLAQDALEKDDDVTAASTGGRWLGYALIVAVPLLAFGAYIKLGNPEAILAQPAQMAGNEGAHDIAAMVAKVEEKVKANPQDAEAWFMLGRSYSVMERWPEAEKAYAEAARLSPKEAAVLSHYAEAIAINADRVLDGKPMALVEQALNLDTDDQKALELAGIHAFQANRFTEAAHFWEQLYRQLPPESAYAQGIADAIKEAKSHTGDAGAPQLDKLMPDNHPPMTGSAAPAAPSGEGISGQVEVSAKLKDKIGAGAMLFIIAKPVGGQGAPLAALRVPAQQLPFTFNLTDAQSMTPQNRLSSQQEVMLIARVSMSGEPMAASGDLEGSVAKVKLGAKNVKVVIDSMHP